MQFSVYLNTENIEDAVLEESFTGQVKALTFLKQFPFFKLLALPASLDAAKAAMQREKQVLGALTMLIRTVESRRTPSLQGCLFEVNPVTGASVDVQGVPSRMRWALFTDTNAEHVSTYAFDSNPDRHFCLLYNDFATRPEAKVYRESANPWRLLVEAFVEAILPEHWKGDELTSLCQTEAFRDCLSEASQCPLHEYECREVRFAALLPNHGLAAYLAPDLAQAAHQGSTEDKIARMKILAEHYAFINGWFENRPLSAKNNRKVFKSIFSCPYFLTLDTQHFDLEVHDKNNGSHQGSFSLPSGRFKAAQAHRLVV